MNMMRTARKDTMYDVDKEMTMRNNTMTLRKRDACSRRRNIALFLAVLIVLVFTLAASSPVSAAGKVSAYGIMTSIEYDGTVIIDKVGYLVSRSVEVRTYFDKSILLRDISLPHHVYFEYEYGSEGVTIIFIKEVAG